MTVYVDVQLLPNQTTRTAAAVVAVHESCVDLTTSVGTRLIGWRGVMYDAEGNEIPLETVRRDFLPTDTASLLARIAELEKLATNNG